MIKGSCLCGAVRIAVDEPLEHAPEACHCIQCRYEEILDDAPRSEGF